MTGGKDKKPDKVKISRETGKKLRQSGQAPPGTSVASVLAKIAQALRDKK